MTLRVKNISEETEELSNSGKEKKSKFSHKDGSFYIVDKKLLRTIFDEPPPNSTPTGTPIATPEGTPVISRKKEEQQETQNTQVKTECEGNNSKQLSKEELKIQDLQMSPSGRKRSNSIDREPENSPGSPKSKNFFRTHRRSSSETNHIILGTPLNKSPSAPDKRLHGSLPVGSRSPLQDRGKDAPPSTQTLEKARQAKNYFEEYYWELLAYLHTRQKRDKKLKKTLQEGHFGKFQQETLVREHLKQETAILRSRRLCGRLSDFILVKKIGKGAYGEVFLCQKRNTKEYLALKKLSKANMHVKNSMAHVQTEKDVLSEADSSWLVHLHYTFQDSEYIYFAMDYIPGGDLRNLIEHVESLPEDQARLYVAEMFLAVDALHTLGYIHRDLKPDNFLIDKDGHLKLADFGLSKKGVMESYGEPFKGQLPHVKLFPPQISNKKNSWKNRAKAYSLVGSPDYMAVEILRGEGYDWKADWWSLGCILFEMIVGFPPFTGETPHEVFTNVLNYQMILENPQLESGEPLIGEDSWDFISKVVCEPEERIGKDSIQEIKDHKFFKGFDWEHVRETKPDFIPVLKNETDTSYFASSKPVTSSENQSGDHPTFLQKINNISNLTFDDMTFSKAIFERDRQFSSGSSDDEGGSTRQQSPRIDLSTGRKSPRGTQLTRKDSSNDMRRMPLSAKGSPIKKVSSLDRLTHTWRVHSRSNRNAASKKEDAVIGEAPSLNYLSIHDWKVICTGAQRIVLPRNAIVIKQGGYNTALYRIKTGAVRIEKQMIEGKQETSLVLGRLEKNKVFGEMSFVEDQWPGEDDIGGNVSASVIVDSDTAELYRIERSFIFSLFLVDKDLFARFYQIIATMLADRIINLPIRDKLQQIRRKDSIPSSPVKVKSTASDDKTQSPAQVTPLNPNRATSPSSKKEAKSKRKRDEKYIKRFKLPNDSYVIQAYKCTLRKIRKDKTHKYHGRLYIGSDYLCFYSRIFGYIYKRAFSYKEIISLKKEVNDEGKVWIAFTVDDKKYFLYDFSDANETEVFKVLEHIYDKINGNIKVESRRGSLEPQSEDDGTKLRTRTNSQTSNTETELFSEEEQQETKDLMDPSFLELTLSQEDWSLILEGSECVTFMKDQVILKQGENFDSIYQIGNGVCRVEKEVDGKVEVLGTLGTSEMFGEISFLGGVGASVDIVADQNNVDIYIITKNYIENLFKEYKGMEGKFYKFLALILSRRIRQRELEEQLRAATSKQVMLSNID